MKILNLDTTKKSSLVAYFSQFLTFWLYGFCFQSATIAQEYPGCFMRDAQNRIINLNSVCSGQPPSEIPLVIPTRKSNSLEESPKQESGQFNSSQLDQRGLEFLLKEYYRPSATSSTNDSSEACAFILDPKDYVKIDNVFSKLSFISAERPIFLIYVPRRLSQPLLVHFFIGNETNFSSIGHLPNLPNAGFQILESPGIFKFRLPPDISPLEIGKKYRWKFAFSCNSKNNFMFSNVIQRELPNPILKKQLETTTNLQERIALYGANSFWYDALTELTKLLQYNPKFNQEDWFKIVSRIGEIIGNDSSKNKTESSEKLNNILEILRTNPQKAITIIQKEKIGDYIHPIALLDKLAQENISLFSEVEIDYYYDEFDTQIRSLNENFDENPFKKIEQYYRELKDISEKNKQLSLLFDDVIYEQYQGEEDLTLLTSTDFDLSNFRKFWEINLTNKNLIEALIEFYQEAWIKAKETDDWQNKWSLLNDLGFWYTQQGNYARAFDSLKQSLAIASLHSDTSITREYNSFGFDKISQSLYNLGLVSYLLGDYANAIEYQKKTFLRSLERDGRQNSAFGASLYALAKSYRAIGNYPRAIDLYSKSFIYYPHQLPLRSSPQDSALNNLGLLYFDLGDFQNAVKQYQQAVERSYLIKLLALYNLGLVYLAQKDYTRAIESFQKLLVFRQELELLAVSPDSLPSYLNNRFSKDLERQGLGAFERAALNNIGLAYFGMGDFNQAINYYQQSLLKAQEFNHVIGEAIALGNQGSALFKSGNFVEAEKKLLEAIKIWESLRQGLNDVQKVYFFENHLAPYRVLQQLYITQNRPQLALEIAERGRARAFLDLLAKRLFSQPEQLSAISFPNLQEIQQIAIAQKATLIEYSIVSSKELFIWVVNPKGEIAFRRTDINFLNSPLKTFVSNTRESIGVRNRGQAQILAFAPGDLIELNTDPANNEPWQVVDFDPKSNLLKLTQSSFPEGITIQRPATDVTNKVKSQRTNNRSLQQLYQLLIEPIADLLPTNQNERVIFIPQGELFLVPFPALQDAKGKYLIEKHTILTAPSIQVLDLTRKQREKLSSSAKDILIVGNPTMPKVPLAPGEPRQQLAALPEAEKEATTIAKLLQTQPLLHDQATKAAIVQRMPNAKVLHFATHALLDDFRGVGSAIAFTPSENDNGMLTADEILNLKLSGELVVLSACNTGQGRITGDGVIGLSRSFISAGIPSIIVSLWSVPDAPTALLMVEFYRNWQQSGDKAVALRQAMLTAMQQHPNPQDWAAFTLIGEAK